MQGQVCVILYACIETIYILHWQEYVSLKTSEDNGKDIISELLEDGLLRFEKNRRCSPKLVNHFILLLFVCSTTVCTLV